MDLERHLAVLWRQRRIVAGGLLLGLVTAFFAAYKLSPDGIERRGTEEWSSNSTVLVTQEGFPEGRVTLPGVTGEGQVAPLPDEQQTDPKERLDFADPTRFASLALLYSVISHSDEVRATLPGHPSADQIKAVPFDPTGRGDQLLPVLQITTTAGSAGAAAELNQGTVAGLQKTLLREQEANGIPDNQRVRIDVLNQPQAATLLEGRSWTSSILAFLLCVGGAVALAHLLEGLALYRAGRAVAGAARAGSLEKPEPEPVHSNGNRSKRRSGGRNSGGRSAPGSRGRKVSR